MTMLDTLFGLIPEDSRGNQWLAEDLQLINWGGYDGAHRVKFAPGATLLCGGSGSGKSTLMDAYIALMMPHTTPFNGASNGGVAGRPRGDEQRNILSYGRGKIDESRTENGTKVRVLRGDGQDTWTAVAMTWVDHDGSRFTAVRAWYIGAAARVADDLVKVRGTFAGDFDLTSLEPAAAHRLRDSAVRETGLETYPTDREFSAKLHSVLGIGAAGSGSKALNLLSRIQAGQQITTVDELYKRMVLEEPATFATADAVVEHFDELEGTREKMVTARRQLRALSPIRGMKERIDEATGRLELLDEVGQFSDPTSVASLWKSRQRRELLTQVRGDLQQQFDAADHLVEERQRAAAAAEEERDRLEDVLRASGGEQLETADRELKAAQQTLTQVQQRRERFLQSVGPLRDEVEAVTSDDSFAELIDRAREVRDNPDEKTVVRDAFFDAKNARNQADRKLRELENEHRQLSSRHGNIPAPLHEARLVLAESMGVGPDKLPFVGELIEVASGFEEWREAFNLALGGFATTLLVDSDNLSDFRVAVDQLRLNRRLRYEGVETGVRESTPADGETLPGRLDYRSSEFTGWLQDRLEDNFGFVCVDDPKDLGNHTFALTVRGQMSQGNRGAHGGHGRDNVLGFSNDRRIAELAEAITAATERRDRAAADESAASEGLDDFEARFAAYGHIVEMSWGQIDVDAAEDACHRWSEIRDEITSGNPEIAGFREKVAELGSIITGHIEEIGRAKGEKERATARLEELDDEIAVSADLIEAAENAGLSLYDTHLTHLNSLIGEPTGDLAGFDAAVSAAAKHIAEDRRNAHAAVHEQRENLRRTLENFLSAWPNPNLRADPETSLRDFERFLDDLEASGLHEMEDEWKQSLVSLSGNDLTNLDSTLSRAVREIRERIEPINRIMADLPFYDDDHRLQITPRESRSEVRRRFRAELREVRALIENASSDDEREQAYERTAKLINRIRRTAPNFADLIDVRNHVRVSAEKIDAVTGAHAALYDHIGEKSGGESQELIAFIVGAALRYQLGDADAARPRYAPVLLDEALIKADAHFTKRAIGAWRGLGFQLVIGAPNDKYSAIEPHVDVEYDILKDTRGRSWAKPKVAVA